MMRLIIIPSDGFVSINGKGYTDIDLSFLDQTINAVQWYESSGEVERKDDRGRVVANEEISSLGLFEQAIDLWTIKNDEYNAQLALLEQQSQEFLTPQFQN